MKVEVRVKPGQPFNRKEKGQLVSYEPGQRLTVSQHVYERFADRFECIGEPPPSQRHTRRPPVPGTDDEAPARSREESPIIVTGRPAKSGQTTRADERPLKTGAPDPAPAKAASAAGNVGDGGHSSSTSNTPDNDEARATSEATSGAGTAGTAAKPRQAKKKSKKKTASKE